MRLQKGQAKPASPAAAPAAPATLKVPNVTGQVYVFAKGILQDQGFAWHVAGPVHGYAVNRVAVQRPRAGSVVLDTGAPSITLVLERSGSYAERGTPDDDAPYTGTAIGLLADGAATKARPRGT